MSRQAKEPDTSTFVGKISAEIRRRREGKKLLVAVAAATAGVPPTTWYRWEKSEGLPLDALPAIAKAVGCTPADLVGGGKGQKARKK